MTFGIAESGSLGVTVNGPPLSVGSAQEQERNRSGECLHGDLNPGELASTNP
jgi:hypothetical protein